MLRRLTVRNLAIVEDLELELDRGLTVITGETGAGKSILVDALALLAGGRGSSDLVRQGAPKLVVAGEFDANAEVREELARAGLPGGETALLRRELSSDGKGRAFVEDEVASVRTLARVGGRLVLILGQSSEQELVDPGAALEILDAFSGGGEERVRVAEAAGGWRAAIEKRETLEASRRGRRDRLEILDFQIREIEAGRLDEPGVAGLPAERDRLLHADRIRQAGEAALQALSEGEDSAADRVGEAARAFAELAAIDAREEAHRQEAEELKRRIADLAAAARDAADAIEADPDRLTALESRLVEIGRLERKYGGSVGEALARLGELKAERTELARVEDALGEVAAEEAAARKAYAAAAEKLSARRAAAAARFGSAVERELRSLALEKAKLRVALEPAGDGTPRPAGAESATFLFAPNPGEPEKPLEKIASGGELSRLQLAIRSVSAGRTGTGRTLVFDEVDAGIGGRVAEVVGKKLRDLAARDQVLCVTHVPQIAAVADRHFRAEKRETKGRTVATVRLLEGKDRVAEIARMLAGETVPETALRHAKTLLEAAAR